ncbi:MAG: LCP family protein [Actinomycetota bacterium]
MKIDLEDIRPRTQRRPSGWNRLWKVVLIGGLVVMLLAGGAAAYVWKYVNDKIGEAGDSSIKTDPIPPIKGPLNILVLGSDARDVVEGGDRRLRQYKGTTSEGQRSDTLMLIHIARDGGAVGLSFPRDLRVRIPGKEGWHKINAAYNGGPNLVIETVKSVTGLPINHYVEVNYSSFRRIVDAIGGLKLCVGRAYADAESGLYVKKAGCYTFDGSKSLSFVRMRKSDPEGDFGRIKRQQMFIRELMKRVKDVGFLVDFRRVMRLADAVAQGLRTDKNMSLGTMRAIANRLAGYTQSSVDFRTVPSYPTIIGNTSYVLMKDAEAQQLFAAIKNGTSLPPYGKTSQSIPGPADVTLDVRNATLIPGAGKAWADRLRTAGYKVRLVENAAQRNRQRTQIAYVPGAELKAKLLAETFREAELVQSTNLGRVVDCVVLIGEDVAAEALPSASPSASSA